MYAGYADIPIQSMLPASSFGGHLLSEDALSSDNWRSHVGERWQGSVIVFTVSEDVAADPQQARLAQMQLARLVQLLR